MDVKDHELIEELEFHVNRSALIFYFWMRSKFPEGTVLTEISKEYYRSERTIFRYLSALKEQELVTAKSKYNEEKIYIPKYSKTSEIQ